MSKKIRQQYLTMNNLNNPLIEDHDSVTDFQLSTLPFQQACGYTFCHQSEHFAPLHLSQERLNISNTFPHSASISSPKTKKVQVTTRKQIQDSFSEQMKCIEKAYEIHKIDQAYEEVRKFRNIAEKVQYVPSEEEEKFLRQIETEMEDVYRNYQILHQDGWKLQKEKKNLKISSKIQGNTVGVLVEAYLDVKIEEFLQVVMEFDLMKNFMPFMEYSSLEKIVSRNCRIAHCINNFPLLTRRQSFFQGIGYDRMDYNQTIFMYTRSLHDRKDLQQLLGYEVKQSKNAIQLDYKYFIVEYKPETPTSGYIKLANNVDLKLKIPMFLLQTASEGFGQDFYKDIRRLAKNFKGSEWQKKMFQNPDFFQMIQKRIKQKFGDVTLDTEEKT